MKTSSLHRQRGLNLVEILVAALILSIGLLSLAGLQVASLKSVQNATHQQQAAFMIHELFERMRSNRVAALNGDYNTTGVDCSSTIQDCSTSTNCTTAQLATYDLFTVQCGENVSGAINSGAGQQLINGGFQVACVSGDCNAGVRVTFNWTERLANSDIKGVDGGGNTIDMEEETRTMSVDATI